MGFSTEMDHHEFVPDAEEAKRWIIAGIALKSSTPLKPILITSKKQYEADDQEEEEEADQKYCCTTPTSLESRIPARLSCPPAPKKRKASSRSSSCSNYNNNNNNGSVVSREFFNPPDLETIFIRRVDQKA